MSFRDKIAEIQQKLSEQKLGGWLLYDFRRCNELACNFLEIPSSALMTRRLCYWIPQKGEPVKVVSAIEPHHLDHLPGSSSIYRSWQEFEGALENVLQGAQRIAMEYSPRAAVPSVSKIDAGTMEVIRGFGVEVVSSADLLQVYSSIWKESQLQSHRRAAAVLDQTANRTWDFIRNSLRENRPITEYDVQQNILQLLSQNNCVTEGAPICAVNKHSADPHYTPSIDSSASIQEGDFILIDLWCKERTSKAVYADITRVAIASDRPSQKQQEVFQVVRQAQEVATHFVRECFLNHIPIKGCEVDQKARKVIEDAGYGSFFIHRTGHNIDIHDHGSGAHMDDLETHDTRQVLPGTCFSIEPGIYLPEEFGIRLEYDLYVHPTGEIEITGGVQDKIVTLF